jgi:hypothetical protein
MIGMFRTIHGILEQISLSRPVRRSDLCRGDCVLVRTENSLYSIQVLEDSIYCIRGGWFDRQSLSPVETSIAGCTWGGSAIRKDIVAACGLQVEFGNKVVTSRVQEVLVIRAGTSGGPGLRPIHSRELFRMCYGPERETLPERDASRH